MDIQILHGHKYVRLPEDLDTGVWRYLGLSKLISLLDAKALHFARADELGDPFEGAVSALTLAQRPSIAAAEAAMLRDQGFPIGPEEVQEIMDYSSKSMPSQMMINCWHMGNHESAAMWGLYCRSGEGVAIRSTVSKLIDALPEQLEDSAILVSEVSYVDFDSFPVPDRNSMAPFTYKRTSFSHERELRALLIRRPPAPPVVQVPVNLSALIESVYVAPQTADWGLRVVSSLLERYGLEVPVHKSRLDDPALR
jgi:hypothetical protein